jgi:LysR family hydrogen peroxide-inducible transcriptional activator
LDEAADWGVKALERAAQGLTCTTAVHICYGYGIEANNNWKKTLGDEWRQYEKVLPALAKSSIQQVSLECYHSHVPPEMMALLEGKDVMVGVIDVASDVIETPEQIADTIGMALKYVPKNRLIACTNCGLAPMSREVAVKKLEEELDVKIFERGGNEVSVTPLGEALVRQAQVVIEQAAAVKEIAKSGKDPLSGPLKLGIIYTIGPYLLPDLVRQAIERVPQMPLMLQENFTVKLLDMLRSGEIDCAIMAEPFPDAGLAVAPLYDEPFMVAVPKSHPLAKRKKVSSQELKQETMLLLGTGHCFRDQVLEVCPEFARFSSNADGIRKSFEGSSLETIKHKVASGMGVTVVPQLSVPKGAQPHVAYLKFEPPVPTRRVVLAWRRSFTRYEAIAALRNAVYACELAGVKRLS